MGESPKSLCKKLKPVIIISGPPGAGKSTYAKRLAKDLGLRYYTSGEAFRQVARERNLSLVELNILAEKDPEIDLEIDKKSFEEATKGCVVIDSHLASWLFRDLATVTIYIKAGMENRIQRLSIRDGMEAESALEEASTRELAHWQRFKNYYGVDIKDLSLFDLVIDTSSLGIEEAYTIILRFIKRILKLA
ncbi:MAG: AAA family ATPase [Caldisphaeraceae archaeon]|nr:AAA family ATPase [Caldisphaeraceae archaeon]